jgi:transcription termination/antitermination protein NusG
MDESPWLVLHVVANHEKRVAQFLSVRSIEYFLPLYTERSRWTDRWVTVERPLFAGYVFVRFPLQNRISVISVPGVIRLLGNGHAETVSVEEMERIRNGLASGYLLRPHPFLKIGTSVRVRSGIFEGVEGVVAEFAHRCKVILSLNGLNQCYSLEVDLGNVEVIQAPIAKPQFARQPIVAIAHT